jgi:glutaredoxin 3
MLAPGGDHAHMMVRTQAPTQEMATGMAVIEIYTTPLCGYCARAKRLLAAKGAVFTEIDLWAEPGRRAEMLARAEGRTTVPQIFVDGQAIGGSDELAALEAAGELDGLLRPAAGPTAAAGKLG